MARYIDADKLCEALKSMASVQYLDKQNTILGVVSSIENFPTADVVPKSEVEHILSDLKKEIHDKAVYPYSRDMLPYISIKAFDAILQTYINQYDDHRG